MLIQKLPESLSFGQLVLVRAGHNQRRLERQRKERLNGKSSRLTVQATRRNDDPSAELTHNRAKRTIIEVCHASIPGIVIKRGL